MKKNGLFLMMFISSYAPSQVSIQAYGGNKEAEVLGIYDKDFGNRWNYFVSGTVAYDYKTRKVSPAVYQSVNYFVGNNWGASAGVYTSAEEVMPSLGFAFVKETRTLGINLFPAVTYSFDTGEAGLGLYTLLEYTPELNEQFNFYSMLMVESDFSFQEHQASSQIIRLGLENNKKMQFGIGSTISQTGSSFETDINFGLFIGKKF
ncbi:hypothetical protein B0A69_04090 [Chryseobacterium shigense]|uniref:Outer membrane protein beta-barrel domain-containing protein n=1 Tax=Chryseobacterium shigense TaxID=297244 RepID=A0A1N7IRD9_9FLAO|nr:hypothetical protein [Chryseobacterium shigense]PQA95571.1 hypothetical protein B0A69_04090 [Chryseobacterium shigense]SIS39654.1 hypothetical protein SAMN05421639_104453 [Chryseobacterium shigense]